MDDSVGCVSSFGIGGMGDVRSGDVEVGSPGADTGVAESYVLCLVRFEYGMSRINIHRQRHLC